MIRGSYSLGRRTLQTVVFRDEQSAAQYLENHPGHSIVGEVGRADRGTRVIHVARIEPGQAPVRMSTTSGSQREKLIVTQSNGILQGVTFVGAKMFRRPADNEMELVRWAERLHGGKSIECERCIDATQMSTLKRVSDDIGLYVDDFGTEWRDARSGEVLDGIQLADEGVRIAEEQHNGFKFRTAYMSTKKGEWVVYKGPRGGKGWRHSSTGEVRYQKDKPDDAGGEQPKPVWKYPLKQQEKSGAQQIEEASKRLGASTFTIGDRVFRTDDAPSASGNYATKVGTIIGPPQSPMPYYHHRVRFDDGTEDDFGHDELRKAPSPSSRATFDLDLILDESRAEQAVDANPVTKDVSGLGYKLPSDLKSVIGSVAGIDQPVLYLGGKLTAATPAQRRMIEMAINEAIRYRDSRAEAGDNIDYYVFFNGDEAWTASANMYRDLYRDKTPVAMIPAKKGLSNPSDVPVGAPVPAAPLLPSSDKSSGIKAFYPEMGEKPPVADIEAKLSHYGKHYYLYTSLDLSGIGIERLTDESGYPAGHRRNGQKRYKVTTRAFDQLATKYAISTEMLL